MIAAIAFVLALMVFLLRALWPRLGRRIERTHIVCLSGGATRRRGQAVTVVLRHGARSHAGPSGGCLTAITFEQARGGFRRSRRQAGRSRVCYRRSANVTATSRCEMSYRGRGASC